MLTLITPLICVFLLVEFLRLWRLPWTFLPCNIQVGLSKVGLQCMRRGGVTHAVRTGAPHEVVQKDMRVKSKSMVPYYATLKGKDLAKVSKLDF